MMEETLDFMFDNYLINNSNVIPEESVEGSLMESSESLPGMQKSGKYQVKGNVADFSEVSVDKSVTKSKNLFTGKPRKEVFKELAQLEPADRDGLIEEILHLKTIRNEQEEQIKVLKRELQIQKLGIGQVGVTKSAIEAGGESRVVDKSGGTPVKSAIILNEPNPAVKGMAKKKTMEEVLEENRQLKQQVRENEEKFKIQWGRMQKANTILASKAAKSGGKAEPTKTKKEDVYELLQHIYSIEYCLGRRLVE